MTNVPAPTFGANGFIVPAEQDIFNGVMADLNAAFGGKLNTALNTPQGQLATTIAALVSNADSIFQLYTQLVDPAFSYGRMQDAIARINFLTRQGSTATAVQCLCIGEQGVTVPVGATAKAADGNIYSCTEAGTFPAGGSMTLSFACNTLGPVACPANSLNQIYQSISGWDSVNNPTDGVIGNNTESSQAFEARRSASVAVNSIGSLASILGAVLSVPGVLDAFAAENVLGTSATIGGVTLVANSIFVSVVGGAAQDIGNAIWSKKAPGCNYNGNTTVTVTDDNPAYSPPFPTYQVTFEIPIGTAVLFAVVLANNPQVPANAATLVQNAIIAAFSGNSGGIRAKIGETVFASTYYAAVTALGSWVQIRSILVSSINNATATFTGSIAGNTLTVSGSVVGAIAIGQTLLDAAGNIAPGTTIVSGSGTSWVTSGNPQTVSSESMATALPNQTSTPMNINQVPTINASNIAVSAT
jgi:hypothetical protein